MSKALDIYKKSISSTHSLSEMYAYMEKQVVPFDIMNLLRAEYVMIVSAFDTYFHNCVLLQMLEMFGGSKNKSKGFENFEIPLSTICAILEDDNPITRTGLLQNAIRKINENDSFQGPQSIEYATSLMGLKGIWKRLSEELGLSCDSIKTELSLIIRRRNQIAHESDIDYDTGEKREMLLDDVARARKFLTMIVEQIDTWL
ncbi:MAG: hypothetical protein IJ200_13080 [Prevotella sp.]|nr:hypothetical protein [Prevotella sp.]